MPLRRQEEFIVAAVEIAGGFESQVPFVLVLGAILSVLLGVDYRKVLSSSSALLLGVNEVKCNTGPWSNFLDNLFGGLLIGAH